MQSHEYANIFPMMNEAEFDELCKDMAKNGYRPENPIITYEGKILDGRNRFKASETVGILPMFTEYGGGDPLGFVLSQNLHRRHLNESQRGVVASRLANLENGQRASFANLQSSEPVTQQQAADLLNVSPRTVATIKAVEREAPEFIPMIESGEMTAHQAQKKVKEAHRKEENKRLIELSEQNERSEACNIFHGDIRTVKLEKNSIDAIITDPPYPKEYLPLWNELGSFAKENLKVGGVLLAMIPAPYLPKIMQMLGEHLTYQWILACRLPGNHGSVIQYGVRNVLWKPILVYRNGGEPVNIGSDMFDNDKRDKEFHEWGQGVGGYMWQVENFTKPNDLICDPFVGGGTTAVAARKLSRRFVGFDVDTEKVFISKGRVNDAGL